MIQTFRVEPLNGDFFHTVLCQLLEESKLPEYSMRVIENFVKAKKIFFKGRWLGFLIFNDSGSNLCAKNRF